MTQSIPFHHPAWPCRALRRYACIDILGAGGCGVVFRALDRLSGREVAIKLPHREAAAAGWTARARLLREAETLRAARHHNVVALHAAGVVDGLVYLVMPILDAAPLDARPLAWRAALAVGRQIGAALATVHSQGLVHRDVAPRNILVAASGRAWLIDFGLARAMDPSRSQVDDFAALALSGPGTGPGSPQFAAPEQRRGERVDGRADQYGLCATLLRGLAGSMPAGDRRAPLPDRLAAVLRRGMAEAPAHRFGDMRALVDALAGCSAT